MQKACKGIPETKQNDFDKWLADQDFYSRSAGVPIDRYILESYKDVVEQFIKSPESKATIGLLETATLTIKKYLE